jgi:hypothetical protein
MSEFTVRAVDFEEKSIAEKETELLKAHEEQQRHKQIETSQEQGQKNKAKGKTRH